jgi:hypothetical protein
MTFEYRELSSQVSLNPRNEEEPKCRHASCRDKTRDDDADDCRDCSTTEDQPTDNCPPQPDDRGHNKALALLRQQLRDTLVAE